MYCSSYFKCLIIGIISLGISCDNDINGDECQNISIQDHVKYAIPYSNEQEVTFETSNGELINLVIERKTYMWERDGKCVEALSINMKDRDSGNEFSSIGTSGNHLPDHNYDGNRPKDIIQVSVPYEFINPQYSIGYDLIALQDGSVAPVILEDATRSSYEPVERYEFHELFEFNDYTYFNTLEVVWKGFEIENEQAIKKFYYSTERGFIYVENFDGESITLVN